jgi:hypothetical protein
MRKTPAELVLMELARIGVSVPHQDFTKRGSDADVDSNSDEASCELDEGSRSPTMQCGAV